MKPSKLFHRLVLLSVFFTVAILLLTAESVVAQSRWEEDFTDLNEDVYYIDGDAYWNDDDEFFVLTDLQGGVGCIYYRQQFPIAIFTVEFDIPT